MQTVERIADVPMRDDTNNASTKESTENDVAKIEGTGDDIAHPGKRHCDIRQMLQTTANLKPELVNFADALKRAISWCDPSLVSSKVTQLLSCK